MLDMGIIEEQSLLHQCENKNSTGAKYIPVAH